MTTAEGTERLTGGMTTPNTFGASSAFPLSSAGRSLLTMPARTRRRCS